MFRCVSLMKTSDIKAIFIMESWNHGIRHRENKCFDAVDYWEVIV